MLAPNYLTTNQTEECPLASHTQYNNLSHFLFKKSFPGTSLMFQWLRLCTSTAGRVGSIPSEGTKIQHTMQSGQTIKIKKNSKNLTKDK